MPRPSPSHHRPVALLLALAAALTLARVGLPPPPRAPPSEALPPAAQDAGPLRVDPNRDPPQRLVALPGVGPRTAARIVEARARSPFRSPEDLRRVRGIGPRTLARLRPFLVFEGPINPEETAGPR